MKTKYIVGVAIVTAALTTFLLIPFSTRGETQVSQISCETSVATSTPKLSPAQMIWFARLMYCESGMKATAVNPKDLDNTPSYGILQFKPSTFRWGAAQVGIATSTFYMDAESQVAIVENWIINGGIDWYQQFPACIKKLGLPPKK